MPITSESDETRCTVYLHASVDIADAADLKKALLDAILAHKELRLDLSKVTELDITAVQLIWAATREVRKIGMSFAIAGAVPEVINSTARDAGLDAFWELATAPAAQVN